MIVQVQRSAAGYHELPPRCEVQPGVRGDVHDRDPHGRRGLRDEQLAVLDALILAGAAAGEVEGEHASESRVGVVHAVHRREQRERAASIVLHVLRGAGGHPVEGCVGEADQLSWQNIFAVVPSAVLGILS